MTTWKLYQVSFRLLSPLHIGWRKAGTLMQTLPYATGRNMWGAFTERLTREKGENNYKEVGQAINKQLRFTYFFPSTSPEKIECWFWDDCEVFSWLYLNSYTSTALENKFASDGSLHEIEYISPKTRRGESVYLLGYIMEKEDTLIDWKAVLNRLQLGGERKYGWGRLMNHKLSENYNDIFSYVFKESQGDPQIVLPKGEPVLAHTVAEKMNCEGTLEPFVGRETSSGKGFGAVFSTAEICWVPGSKAKEEKTISIMPMGIWRASKKYCD
ncbi:MAG: hypothetical protein C4554_03855 [Dethiobacter sp.]|nr:MAG: hypothetical protein C4554_03855 [Dethiobacter sp.]